MSDRIEEIRNKYEGYGYCDGKIGEIQYLLSELDRVKGQRNQAIKEIKKMAVDDNSYSDEYLKLLIEIEGEK